LMLGGKGEKGGFERRRKKKKKDFPNYSDGNGHQKKKGKREKGNELEFEKEGKKKKGEWPGQR